MENEFIDVLIASMDHDTHAATSALQFGWRSGSNLVTEDCHNGSSVRDQQLAILQPTIRR